jgi:hypothetical protein
MSPWWFSVGALLFYPGDSTYCHPKQPKVPKGANLLKRLSKWHQQPVAIAEIASRRKQAALDRRPGTV